MSQTGTVIASNLGNGIMDLQTLKAALEPLTKFGQDEHSFEVEGQEVTLRPLLPKEEVACHKYAATLLEEAEQAEENALSRADALRYFDQFRTEVISYSLTQIGDTDLREVETVDTGEVIQKDDGTQVAIKEPLHVALRKIIQNSWSRGMISIAFSRYGDMITKVSEKADRVAKESVSDLDAEIERVEARLSRLREERDKRAKGDPSVTAQQIKALVAAGDAMEQEVTETIERARADREAAEALAAEADTLEETEDPEPEPAPEPAEKVMPAQPRKSVIPPSSPPPTSPPPPPREESIGDRIRKAQEVSGSSDLESGDVSKAEAMGPMRGKDGNPILDKDGKPIQAFKLPAETISARGKKPSGVVLVDPDPNKDTKNPRFKPSGG